MNYIFVFVKNYIYVLYNVFIYRCRAVLGYFGNRARVGSKNGSKRSRIVVERSLYI